MELYILEETDFSNLHEPGFSAKKRIIHSEALLHQSLFRGATEDEDQDHSAPPWISSEKSFVINGKTRLSHVVVTWPVCSKV